MTKEQAIERLVREWGHENRDVIAFCQIFVDYPILAEDEEYIEDVYKTYNVLAYAHMLIEEGI